MEAGTAGCLKVSKQCPRRVLGYNLKSKEEYNSSKSRLEPRCVGVSLGFVACTRSQPFFKKITWERTMEKKRLWFIMPSSSTLLCLMKPEYPQCDQPLQQQRQLCSKMKIKDGMWFPATTCGKPPFLEDPLQDFSGCCCPSWRTETSSPRAAVPWLVETFEFTASTHP